MSKFFIWLHWLHELGGTYEYFGTIPDGIEKPAKTGRRDPDRKPRTYKLDPDKYGTDKRGVIYKMLPYMLERRGL
jgi:hypothetical protein